MSSFKTKAGTELPLIDLRGKDYLQVAYRLVWFREEHPDYTIETEAVLNTPSEAIFKAVIKDTSGRILATAHKFENKQGFGDFMEKAETGSIGRALALCGYGTQFAPEILEEDRIVDGPLDKKDKYATKEQLTAVSKMANEKNLPPNILKQLFADHGVNDWNKVSISAMNKVIADIKNENYFK